MSSALQGLFGLIIFILNVWAIAKIINSRATTLAKVLWVLLILFLPFLGLVIWFFLGPKGRIQLFGHTL